MHAIVYDLKLVLSLVVLDELSDVGSSWQIKHKVVSDLGICLVQMLQIVRLHV